MFQVFWDWRIQRFERFWYLFFTCFCIDSIVCQYSNQMLINYILIFQINAWSVIRNTAVGHYVSCGKMSFFCWLVIEIQKNASLASLLSPWCDCTLITWRKSGFMLWYNNQLHDLSKCFWYCYYRRRTNVYGKMLTIKKYWLIKQSSNFNWKMLCVTLC